jgi:hypothetical protein
MSRRLKRINEILQRGNPSTLIKEKKNPEFLIKNFKISGAFKF